MSKRYFDSMLEDMDYINYYRWCSNQSFTNFGVPVNMYPNQYDLFNRGCYLPPYTLVPNTSKKNREAYYLFKRNEDRNFFPNNFYFGNNHFKGQHFNRRFEDNRKLPRSSASIDLMPRNNARRQFSNWSGSPSGQPCNGNQDENWFMRRQNRGFNKDNNFQPSTSRLDNRQNKFEYSDTTRKDEMLLTGQMGFHRSSPSLTNDKTNNQNLDNSTKGFGKNSSNTQLTMNSTAISSPKHSSEYDTWFSVDEQQQIINVLKDVNYRHERQLWCDMQSIKTIDHMSLDTSTTSSVDHDSSDCQYGSFSSDEDDGITVLVSPTDHPLNDVMDPEIHLSIGSDDLIEKSTSDYFEEFQNIFTTSPEKNIINTLVKECFKEQPIKNLNEVTSIERNVSKDETVSDQCNNNESEVLVEVASSEHNSSTDSNGNESIVKKATSKVFKDTEATKLAYSEKISRLSPDMPLARCFESSMRPLVIESAVTEETPDGSELPKYGPVIKVPTAAEHHAEVSRVTYSEKNQRSGPVIQMSQGFEMKKAHSSVATAVKDDAVAVLSGSSEIPTSFVIPKYRPVIEMKQISMPAKFQINSSRDQIVLTDYHRRKIQMQKYDFDCRFKNACDFKPFKPNSQPPNNFPASQMWKSIRSVYNSATPSVHSINDYRNLIFNLNNNSNKNFNKLPHVPMKSFHAYEHRERSYRQAFEIPSEKGHVPFPSKNARISSHRMPEAETGSMVQSDSCLLRNFRLPQSDYEKSSMSESHLQVKSSKDLDRLYKRISLEDLFSSGDPDKSVKSSNLMNIPPFRSDVKLVPISTSSFVSPTDHLKRILKIGNDSAQAATSEERVKYQVPFPNKVEKTRISTGCQTEATDDRFWNRTASETSQKVAEVCSNNLSSASKVVESNNKKKVTVKGYGLAGKDDIKSDGKTVNLQSTDDIIELRNQNNKVQVEDSTYVNKKTEQAIDAPQKDEEKVLTKKGSRKKGKANRNKSKLDFKNDPEISCCEKCRHNIDIMNFSENEMQFDVKQNGAGVNVNGMKKLAQMKTFEEPVKTQPGQVKEIENMQVKAVLLNAIKSKPIITEDIVVKSNYRAKRSKPKTVYKDVFKEFSKSKDFSASSTNKSPRNLSDVSNYKEDSVMKEQASDEKILLGSKPFKFYPVNRSSSDTSQHIKSLKSDYNSLLQYKMTRPKKVYRRFEKPNISEDESTGKVQPMNEEIRCKSSHEFRSKHQEDETRIDDIPSILQSDQCLENNEEDQNSQGPLLHTKCNNLDVPRHPKKAEGVQEMCAEKVQFQDKATLDAKNGFDDLTATSALGTSLKYHIKPGFSIPNGICEKPPAIDSKKTSPKIKERFVHNANAPFQEKLNGPMNPKETIKNESEIASTG